MDNELDALDRQPVADGVSQSELIKALGGKWITNTEEIQGASAEILMRQLLTDDGNGKQFKSLCLRELLSRKSN